MRTLLAIIAALALGWGGYWYVGARALEDAYVAWFDARRAEGWQAEFAALDTRGFPNRFDTTLRGVQLADPETGWAWTTPFFQVLALSYNPGHVIAIWPRAHTFATPQEVVEIKSEDMRGSIVFASLTALEVDRSQVVIAAPVFTSSAGWTLSASEMRYAVRRNEGVEFGYDIASTAVDLNPGGAFAEIASAFDLPPTWQDFNLDATVGFSKAWDRTAIEVARPQPREVSIRIARAAWGDMLFQAAGDLEIDRAGVPTGELSLQVRNWRQMLEMLSTAGVIPESVRPGIEGALELLAGITGNPDHIDVTLSFRAGFVSVGIVPIGPAPLIRLR